MTQPDVGAGMDSDQHNQLLNAINEVTQELRQIREISQSSSDIYAKLLWEARTDRLTQNVIRNSIMSNIYFEIQELIDNKQLGFLETVETIRLNRISFARFGDGELRLMLRPHYQLQFQRNSDQLSRSLKSIFTNHSTDLLIGFPHLYRDQHWSQVWSDIWRELAPYLAHTPRFGNSHVSRPIYFETTGDEGVAAWRKIWDRQSVAVITGRGSNFDLVPELFSNAKSKTIIESAPENAFEDLDRVTALAQDADVDLFLISLGPAGTVLSHNLSQQGHWAIDIGHISDSYRYSFDNGDWPEAQYRR